ncbi:MAG: sugar 3,4-ketoisomerase [Caulobacteraceae bacterium]
MIALTPPVQPDAESPSRDYGLDLSRLIDVATFTDERGAVGVVEAEAIPFAIERIYFLYGVPAGKVRGDHGHRTLQQFFIPLSGHFTVSLHDGEREASWVLDDPAQGLYVPPMMWRSVHTFSPDGVCLVLASETYDKADYYHSFETFTAEARKARGAS